MKVHPIIFLSISLIWTVSCGDSTVVPQPDPLPIMKRLLATNAPLQGTKNVELVGLPGAVVGVGLVRVTGLLGTVQTSSTSEGTFALRVEVKIDPTAEAPQLQVQFNESDQATFELQHDPSEPEPPSSGMIAIEPGDMIKVTGSVVDPLSMVVAANFTTGAVATTTADSNGVFTLWIAAVNGDEVHLYGHGGILSDPFPLMMVPPPPSP